MSTSSASIAQVGQVAGGPTTQTSGAALLIPYFLITYAALLLNASSYMRQVQYETILTFAYSIAVFLTYAVLYMLPALAPPLAALGLARMPGLSRRIGVGTQNAIMFSLAVLGATFSQTFVFADRFIFRLYGFHINGFVWNLVWTRGGIESLGGDASSTRSFLLIIAVIIAIQAGLLALVLGSSNIRRAAGKLLRRRRVIAVVAAFAALAIFERVTYGISTLRGYRPVLAASQAFPLYIPTTLTKLARSFGVEPKRQESISISGPSIGSGYPRRTIERDASRPLPNVVWLVSESLRCDMVDPEIMPNSWRLAQESVWCRRHYSGGNGTRMGMFSMFYGLYGCYWFPMLAEQRSPVLIDEFQKCGYQMEMFTSASFSYPEFDRTVLVNVPKEHLHEAHTALPWRRDIENVSDILGFLDHRDRGRPFMTFMFFESPHACYHFPENAVIRRPYTELNYATLNVQEDIIPIKNRYINAVHHMDAQVGRVLDYLRENDLMKSTIVIVTGDHGEEFMEKGRWGHNSTFSEEQTRPPFVLWVPGVGHREINTLTSHLDIPATLLTRMGVANPPGDYSLGFDILGDERRPFTVVCDWNHVAYVDTERKVVLPFRVSGFAEQKATTVDDQPLTAAASKDIASRGLLTRLMGDMRAFSR